MRLKRTLALFILGITANPLQATTVEDVYTAEHIKDAFVMTERYGSYCIAADGSLRGIGKQTMGQSASGLVDIDEWAQVGKDVTLDPYIDVVKIRTSGDNLLALTEDGKVYQTLLTSTSGQEISYFKNYTVKDIQAIDIDGKVSGSSVTKTFGLAALTDNDYLIVCSTTGASAATQSLKGLGTVKQMENLNTPTYGSVALLFDSGIIYTFEDYGGSNRFYQMKVSSKPVTNIHSIHSTSAPNTLLTISKTNTLHYITDANKSGSTKMHKVKFYNKNNIEIQPQVVNVLTGGFGDTEFITTTDGIYEFDKDTLSANEIELPFFPVALQSNSDGIMCMDISGDFWVKGTNTNGTLAPASIQVSETEWTAYDRDWMSLNPILEDVTMAKFNIKNADIYSRQGSLEIESTLTLIKEPTRFDLFYVTLQNPNNRVVIQTDLTPDQLNMTKSESSFVINGDTPVYDYNINYNWNYPDEDLRNIQIGINVYYE